MKTYIQFQEGNKVIHMIEQNKIPGGLADDSREKDFDPEQIQKGIEVELEHTSDRKLAKEIALDHLEEDDFYYDKLEKMESEF